MFGLFGLNSISLHLPTPPFVVQLLPPSELINIFEKGLDNYFNQEWDYAIKLFNESIF